MHPAIKNRIKDRNFDYIFHDVDDTWYAKDCGLHQLIKDRIVAHANHTPDIRARAKELLDEDRDFTPKDMGDAFPKIAMARRKEGIYEMENYFDAVYGDDYHLIAPNPRFVLAFHAMKGMGIQNIVYSNGPSSPQPGKDYHIQKVMRRLGFDDEMVDEMRGNTYDLLNSIEEGAGKPTPEGMVNFLVKIGLFAEEKRKRCLVMDDDRKVLETASRFGIRGVWINPEAAAALERGDLGNVPSCKTQWGEPVLIAASPADAIEQLVKARVETRDPKIRQNHGDWRSYGL